MYKLLISYYAIPNKLMFRSYVYMLYMFRSYCIQYYKHNVINHC